MDWNKFMKSETMTQAEKDYIFDGQYRNGGSFMRGLYELIQLADEDNIWKLHKAFPDEVDAVLAWTRGDLADRARALGIGL
jgi:hypothetical protein